MKAYVSIFYYQSTPKSLYIIYITVRFRKQNRIVEIFNIITLFPKQPITPHPTQETLGSRMYGLRSPRTQTVIKIPTICLLMIHLKSWETPLILLSLSSLVATLLFKVSLINEFHFAETLLLSDPKTFEALSGTTSWNLQTCIFNSKKLKTIKSLNYTLLMLL